MSGVAVHLGPDTPTLSFAGEDYHFCCAGCAEQFAAEPTHFLRGVCRPRQADSPTEDE